MRSIRLRFIAIGVVALLASSSDGRKAAAAAQVSAGLQSQGSNNAIVCHVNDTGAFVPLSVNSNAVPGHMRHGDGRPGGAVPGGGYVFGPTCELLPNICPCDFTTVKNNWPALTAGLEEFCLDNLPNFLGVFQNRTSNNNLTAYIQVYSGTYCSATSCPGCPNSGPDYVLRQIQTPQEFAACDADIRAWARVRNVSCQ